MPSIETIFYDGIETLSFRQIDQLNQLPKGSGFRLFKAGRQALVEGADYFYLPASTHSKLIETLKTTGQIYATTVNLVLFTRAGYDKLRQHSSQAGSGT